MSDDVDPGDLKAVETVLAAPIFTEAVINVQLVIDGRSQNLAIQTGVQCSLCYAVVHSTRIKSHEDWHRRLAAAISNAANMSATLNSLMKAET